MLSFNERYVQTYIFKNIYIDTPPHSEMLSEMHSETQYIFEMFMT